MSGDIVPAFVFDVSIWSYFPNRRAGGKVESDFTPSPRLNYSGCIGLRVLGAMGIKEVMELMDDLPRVFDRHHDL